MMFQRGTRALYGTDWAQGHSWDSLLKNLNSFYLGPENLNKIDFAYFILFFLQNMLVAHFLFLQLLPDYFCTYSASCSFPLIKKKTKKMKIKQTIKQQGLICFMGHILRQKSIQAVTQLLFTEFIPVYSPKDQKFGEKSEKINPKIGSAPFTDLDSQTA